jgi:kanamycin kinase/aminoglycoside 3'-phosphotransferase-2
MVTELMAEMPIEEPVFIHGDYCLPNILVAGDKLGGVIDWDFGGLADP